ncbi:MAG: formyl transferase, partial [Burkholderia sp.]|nr:formyl transferase [Burkholderia sp.]
MTKVLFMGRKPVAADALDHLLKLPRVEVVGVLTDSHLAVSPTAQVALQARIPLYEFSEALTELKEGRLTFDLGISILYWRKLKDEFLSVPQRSIINFHPAPLPEYKGTAGYNLAILEGLTSWAVSAHYVDAGIDTGSIVKVLEFPIDRDAETAQTLERRSQRMLYALFEEVVQAALQSPRLLPSVPNIGGRYISRADMEAMKEIRPGDDVSRKIRAFWFPPYDGAYQLIGDQKYTLVNRLILQQLGDP